MRNYTLASMYNLEDEATDRFLYNEAVCILPSMIYADHGDVLIRNRIQQYSGWHSDMCNVIHHAIRHGSDDDSFNRLTGSLGAKYADVVIAASYSSADYLLKINLITEYEEALEEIGCAIEYMFLMHDIPMFEDARPYKLVGYKPATKVFSFAVIDFDEFKENYKLWNN